MNLSRIRVTLWKLRHMPLAIIALASPAVIPPTIRGLAPTTVSVAVAKEDLAPGVALDSSNLMITEVSVELAPEGLTCSLEDLNERVLITSVPRGVPVARKMTLLNDFLTFTPEGIEIAPVVADVGGADKLLTLGHTVTLCTPPGKHSRVREAVKIVDKATIIRVGPKNGSISFVSDSPHASVLYAAVSQNTISLVIGYGSMMPVRVVVVR